MITKILIQSFVTWQINRFDHLSAITHFLRSQGMPPEQPLPQGGLPRLRDDWLQDGDWLVWRCSQPIPPTLIQQHFVLPRGVQLETDPDTGSAVISCEKSRTAIGYVPTIATATAPPSVQPAATPPLPLPALTCETFLPLTDWLSTQGVTPAFTPGQEAAAREVLALLFAGGQQAGRPVRSSLGQYAPFAPLTTLDDMLKCQVRGWLICRDGPQFNTWFWISLQPIPRTLIEQAFVRNTGHVFHDVHGAGDFSLHSRQNWCSILSLAELRRSSGNA